VTEKAKEVQVKKPNAIQRWWKETIGELRKVSWPSTKEAWRLTVIVLLVMVSTSALLGLLDFLFSKIITALLA
jgi:preprotein translocase subunit SecE